MSNPFADPATSTGITWGDHLGALMLIEPTAMETGIVTSLGERDAVRGRVSVITGDGEADVYDDTLIFPRVLIGQLRSRIGEKVLGRLGQGNAKPGQNPPWTIVTATEDDVAKGVAYLDARGKQSVTTPAPAAAAPAGQQAGNDVPF